MSDFTKEEILEELKRRGATDGEVGFASLDSQANHLRSWLDTNAFKKGTEENQKVSEQFEKTWGCLLYTSPSPRD